jgi:hypothetical protein
VVTIDAPYVGTKEAVVGSEQDVQIAEDAAQKRGQSAPDPTRRAWWSGS